MSPRDYCFWLMGACELNRHKRSSLTCEKSMTEIRQHLSLVLADTNETYQYEYPGDCLGLSFCHWLDRRLANAGPRLTLLQLDKIQKRLSQIFTTEIDPSFSNSAQLQDIHDGVLSFQL